MSVSLEANAPPLDLTQVGPESIITFPQGLVGGLAFGPALPERVGPLVKSWVCVRPLR